MLDSRQFAPIWLIWPYLSILERLSFTALCVVCIYALYVAVTVVVHFRNAAVQQNLVRIRKRMTHVQQATIITVYLFGFVLFASLQFAYSAIGDSSTPVGMLVLRNFQVHFAFADNVFLILLVFQFVHWFAANRVALRSNA